MITKNQIRKNLYSLMAQAGLTGPDTELFGVNDTVVGIRAERV